MIGPPIIITKSANHLSGTLLVSEPVKGLQSHMSIERGDAEVKGSVMKMPDEHLRKITEKNCISMVMKI